MRPVLDVATPLGNDVFEIEPAPMQFSSARLQDGTPVFVGSTVQYQVLGARTADGALVSWCPSSAIFVTVDRSQRYNVYGQALDESGEDLQSYDLERAVEGSDQKAGGGTARRIRVVGPSGVAHQSALVDVAGAKEECPAGALLVGHEDLNR